MRPVNLIPEQERHGARKPLRTGPLAYVVVGALVAALLGITAMVMTGNEISEREDEITQLQSEDAAAKARLARLDGYTEFHSVAQQRIETVAGLATSRFDWERVMRELARVLPSDVWLSDLTGTASAGASVDGGSSGEMRETVAGPALELSGCALGQESVAGFVQALKEIDGVTRVGVESSELGDLEEESSEASDSSSEGGSDCQTRSFIATFDVVVAFDAAPAPIANEAEG